VTEPHFPFVQFDLASGYGLTPGRYPVRPAGQAQDAPEGVLILDVVDAPLGRRRRRRARPRDVKPGEEAPTIHVHRATVVRADSFPGEVEAGEWLAKTSRDDAALEEIVGDALRILNRALHAQRAAAQDAFVPDLSRDRALAVRVGYGLGDALAGGEWSAAVDVPPSAPRSRRVEALRPQERIAAVLGGRENVSVCESLLLRARGDLDAGRLREAALELRSAVAALLIELEGTGGVDQAADLVELETRREALAEAARVALRSDPDSAELEATLGIAERVIRRRRILG
jgi:hypothetical protein